MATSFYYNIIVEFSTSLRFGEVMKERYKTFTVLVSSIMRSIRKIKTEEMAEFNLKSPHVSCLYYLYKANSLTAKELCDICEEDKASVSRSIDFLESNGYIQCDSPAKKRYKAALTLTEKGKEVGEKVTLKIDKALDLGSVGLSEENRVILYKSLALINENLQNMCKKYDN